MKLPQFNLHAKIEEKHWWFLGRRAILHTLIRRLIPAGQGKVIVDIGCGTGGNIAPLAGSYSCIGLDTSPDAVHLAEGRFSQAQFVCAANPDEFTPFIRKADLCLLTDVIEHVPDDFSVLSGVLSAMKPGSHLLITVPADMRLWTEHDISFGHYRRYDRKRLALVWEGLPVTQRLLSYYNTWLFPPVLGIRALNSLLKRTSGEAGTDFKTPARPINALLTGLFASERNLLLGFLDNRGVGFPFGVSLVAVLRREEGVISQRSKPREISPDTGREFLSMG